MSDIQEAIKIFSKHYSERLGGVTQSNLEDSIVKEHLYFSSDKLKPENGPRILSHGTAMDQTIILTHGLTDCPFYVLAIGKHFYRSGYNVILPLLPAHGLKAPDDALEDKNLDKKWRATIDNAVEVAQKIGGRISIGGFSTGGALSLNKILRDPEAIKGALLLISAALSIGSANENLSRLGFLQAFAKITDGENKGIGPNPYKYPQLPNFAGIELGQIINENNSLLANQKLSQPVIAMHSVLDETALLGGITDFLKDHVEHGTAMLVSEGVAHDTLPLEEDIIQDESMTEFNIYPSKANPQFAWMMKGVLNFFENM